MQKGTVIEGEVMHRDFGGKDADGAKPCGGSFVHNRKDTYSNPAKNLERETVTASVKDNSSNDEDRSNPLRMQTGDADTIASTVVSESQFQSHIPYAKPEIDLCSNIKSIGGVKPKRMGAFLTRMFAIVLAAVMTASLGVFANDAFDMVGGTGRSAHASTTTPYTNIDVPLTSDDGNNDDSNPNAAASNSDNASPDRVEAGDEIKSEYTQEAGILGPTLSSVSGRASDDADSESSDGDTYMEGAYTYERIKDESGEDTGKVKLVKVDTTIGKVARIEANVAEIASGAFIECEELQTLIVFGNVRSIAKPGHDVDGNITQEGAFTEEQLKNVHVVFATTYLDETSLHETHPVGSGVDAEEGAESDKADRESATSAADDAVGTDAFANDANANGGDNVVTNDGENVAANGMSDKIEDGNTDATADGNAKVSYDGAGALTTPVDEGIKRLSGDVVLSAPSIKDDANNVWLQMGFENIVETPQIGAKGTAVADNENSNSPSSQIDEQTGADIETASNDLSYTLTSNYILKVAWNGNDDMPADLEIPEYGQVDGTTYKVSEDNENSGVVASPLDLFMSKVSDNLVLSDMHQDYRRSASNDDISGEFHQYEGAQMQRLHSKTTFDLNVIDNKISGIGYTYSAYDGSIECVLKFDLDTYGNKITGTVYQYTDESFSDLLNKFEFDLNTSNYKVRGNINHTGYTSTPIETSTISINLEVLPENGNLPNQSGNSITGSGLHYDYSVPGHEFEHLIELRGNPRVTSQRIAIGIDYHNSIENTDRTVEWRCSLFLEGPVGFWIHAYEVTLDPNGGAFETDSNKVYVRRGEQYGTLPTPNRNGYSFAGWFDKAVGGNQIKSDSYKRGEVDETLYAHWTANQCTVSFNANGGSGGQSADVTATYDAAMPTISTTKPTRTGYTFGGWYDTSAASGGTQYYTAAGASARTWDKTFNTTLYARWIANSYTVTYNKNKPTNASNDVAGTTSDSSHAYDASKNLTSNGYSLTGWRFDSWNTAANGSGTKYTDRQSVKNLTSTNGDTITLYAQWAAKATTVSFNANGGSGGQSANVTATYDSAMPTISTTKPTRTGYTFGGWYDTSAASGGTQYYTAAGASARSWNKTDATCTLYARWTPNTYQVSYDSNKPSAATGAISGTMSNSSHTYDTASALRANGYSLTGWRFNGWNTAANGTGSAYSNQASVSTLAASGTTTLYAQWVANTYAVNYHTKSGTYKTAQTLTYDSTQALLADPGTSWYSTGYTGKGWATSANQSAAAHAFEKSAKHNFTSASGGTYSLYLAETPNAYTVSFDSRGGSAVASKTVTYDSTYGTLATPTRPGYTFDGWFTSATGGTQRTASTTVKITANETLYAHWHPTTYTITRTNKQGSDMATAPITYTIETPTFKIPNPNWQGHNFCGWTVSMSSSGDTSKVPNGDFDPATQELSIEQGTYGNITLSAIWFASEYTVAYSGNGADNQVQIPSQLCKFGEAFTIASPTYNGETLTRRGYAYVGWNTKADGTGTPYSPGQSVKNLPAAASGGETTLYAQWQAIPYKVVFNANYPGSTYGNVEQAYVFDVPQNLRRNTFVRTGYTFAGWYTYAGQPTGTGARLDLYDAQNVTLSSADVVDHLSGANQTELRLYARWTANKYDVTLLAPDADRTRTQLVSAEYGSAMPTMTMPERTGYAFDGFWTDDGANMYYDEYGNSARNWDIPHATTLYAHWKIVTYQVRYVPGGIEGATDVTTSTGSPATPQTYGATYGSSFTLRSAADLDFIRAGYDFGGWDQIIDDNGTTRHFGASQSVRNLTSTNGDIVDLYAVWTPRTYALYLDANGDGTSNASFNQYAVNNDPDWRDANGDYKVIWGRIAYNDQYDFKAELTPTRRGYAFAGWWTTPDDTGYQMRPADRFDQLGDQTLYAHWTENAYTLVLKTAAPQSATELMRVEGLKYTDPYTLPGDAYTFGAAGTVTQGTLTITTSNYAAGKTLSAYPLRLENKEIWGWSTESSGSSLDYYAKGASVSRLTGDPEITLYLTQGAGMYSIFYDANGGVGPENTDDATQKNVENGKDVVIMPKQEYFSRVGYTLSGWNTKRDGTGITYHAGTSTVRDKADSGGTYTLYAVWTPIIYTIHFDCGTWGYETKDFFYGQGITRVFYPKEEEIEDGTIFMGYYNFADGDKQLFNASGYANKALPELSDGWRYTGESYTSPSGATVSNFVGSNIYLTGRFVTDVRFEYPYGGEDSRYTSAKFIVGIPYSSAVNATVNPDFKDLGGLPTPVYGGVNGPEETRGQDKDGNVRTFAGWYGMNLQGEVELITNDTDVIGPALTGNAWTSYVLSAAWYVDGKIEMPDYPAYVDAWQISGGVGWNADTQSLRAIQGRPYSDAAVGGLPSGYRVSNPSGYRLVGWNMEGARVYGQDGASEWRDVEGGAVETTDVVVDGLAMPRGHVDNSTQVDERWNYTLYPEYVLNASKVTVEVYEQGIRKGDALEDANYTRKHTYTFDKPTESAITEDDFAKALEERTGFDYHRSVISHGTGMEAAAAYDDGEGEGDLGKGVGIGTSASGEAYDGRVAGDSKSIVRVYFKRHCFELSVNDFHAVGRDVVRGAAKADNDAVHIESTSAYDFDLGSGADASAEVWFGEELRLEARADTGYRFSGWHVVDASSDDGAEIEGVLSEGDAETSIATFTMPDTSVSITPAFDALSAAYAVKGYFQEMNSATEASDGYVADEGRGADIIGTTENPLEGPIDTMTSVYGSASDAEGVENAVIAIEVPGFSISRIENAYIEADGSCEAKVYYDRNLYDVSIGWKDVVEDVDFDTEGKVALIDMTEGGDEAEIPGTIAEGGVHTYSVLYEADVAPRAAAGQHFELLGYGTKADGSNADVGADAGAGAGNGDPADGAVSADLPSTSVWEDDWTLLSDLDQNGELSPDTVDADTAGLPGPSEAHAFATRKVPPRNVELELRAQPLATTYVSRYLFQDVNPESETEAASTYSEDQDHPEITIDKDQNGRLLRFWLHDSDAYAHPLGVTGFAPADIREVIPLTPSGTEQIDGTPANVAISKYDRKKHSVIYSYFGGPNSAEGLDPNGGSAPKAIASYFGANVKVAEDPHVPGWSFSGWTWDGVPVGEGTDAESVVVPDADVDIVGTWAPIEYGLSFDGGTAYDESPATNLPDAMSIPYDSEWAVPGDVPARNGYTFLGWTFADKAIFEAIASGPIDISTGDVDDCKAALSAMNDFDGNPLLMEPGQSQVWTWWKGDRTLHAVWMRSSYDVTFDLGQGTWPNGTSVPLTYMTGAEVRIPQPTSEGYEFTGWEITCDGSELEGDAPAVSYVDGDSTRATINEWAYGNVTFTAKYDVKRFAVNLNPAGGTFDGEPEEFMDRDVDYASPNGDGAYGQATVHIPFDTEITSTTPLPEPKRPGYDFSGWTDGQGNPVGWTLDDDGNKVDVPYMFDDAKDATWVATWRAHRYQITYDFGEYSDSGVTIDGIDAFSEYFAGMIDEAGNVVTSFMLPTADDIKGLPENVGFDGWYPAGGNPDSDRMRSFDPNATTGDKEFVAVFSKGANVYTERFWLEVLDQTEDMEGKQYAFIGDTKFALDDSLSVTRRTDAHNAMASMSAISGFTPVNPYDDNGDLSIYPGDQPYLCVFSTGKNVVNGFYTRETRNLTVGTANGIEDDETLIQVSPASALVKDADVEDGSYAMDESTNVATLKGVSHATVKWGAKVNVGVTCPRSSGHAFVAWQTDAGATPADIDVRANPATFTMPDADVALNPSTEFVRFKATYRDAFGKDVFGAGQATFTVNDEFALKNLDDVEGHAFRGWEAYVADEDGNKLDPEANPVPSTVGYDEDQEHMWVREGTATDLIFEAKYAAIEYSVSVTLPKGTSYLPNGMPDGLPQIEGIDWVLMPGSDGTDVIGFNYTIEDLSEPLVVDLTGVNCAPYEVNSWRVAGVNGESNVPSLEDGVLTLTNSNLGDWRLDPDVIPIKYELTLDMSDVREGYVPIDVDALISELESAGYVVERIEDGKLKVTFDVETASAYTLPTFEREDEDSTPEFAFRGWAKTGDAANASNPYVLPPADIAGWPKEGVVIAPVWARSGEQTTLVAHLPNDEGDYVDDLTFTFVGDALTPIDYSQDERFVGLVNDVYDENVGYHLVWHGTPGLTDDDVTTLPTNFPESGTQEVWGEWVEDDDIITVGFGVKWDNSAPPGEVKPRSAFALNASDFVSDDADSDPTSTFSMRNAYASDEMPTDGVTAMDGVAVIDEAGDAIEAPIADANSTYYYIPNKGLYVKDVRGKYHIVTRIANIEGIAGTYAGWRLEGFYLPIDEQKPERIIIGPDGTVDNTTFVEVAGAKPSDLTFTVRWARISLVEIGMVGGYGEGSEDLILYYWPEKDAFVKGDDAAIGDAYSAPRAYSKGDFNTGVMLGTFATKGIPESKEDADGTHAFIGYFGETSSRKWDLAKDADGNPLPAANALALTPTFSYLAITDDHKKQVTVGTDAMDLPYGYDDKDDAAAYDPTSKDGTTKVTWRAAWEGDLDAIYFNATVPMSMSFMVRADGTAIGPEAGAYQIRNYSNTAISVEDVTFEWAEESELEALFGKGATDALALSATPTDGQPGYAQTKVLLERANATRDAVGAALVSRYVFDADKWVIAKSIGMDPDDFTGDATTLPALKLDYNLTAGGIKQLTQENASQDTTHPIGTLKFTLKTVR